MQYFWLQTSGQSVGTTTVGADMSPAIPSMTWVKDLSQKLEYNLPATDKNYPLLLIDSEGMGVRDEIFDFMTTSPPAVLAKVIVWVSEGKVETNNLLKDIGSYMNGLDNIILSPDQKRGKTFCEEPYYGYFFITINKLMDDTDDVTLYSEIMYDESGGSGADERNQIRQKIRECFNGVTVIGLPYVTLEEGQEFDYPALNDRFKKGLHSIASIVRQNLDKPR